MTIIDLVKKFSEKKHEKSNKFKQMQEDDRLNEMLINRKKSSNERELDSYIKQKREDNIKRQLDNIHKQQNTEMWKSKHSILDKGKLITKTNRPILKEKHIFKNKNTILKRRGLF